jgi:hypothetical protein
MEQFNGVTVVELHVDQNTWLEFPRHRIHDIPTPSVCQNWIEWLISAPAGPFAAFGVEANSGLLATCVIQTLILRRSMIRRRWRMYRPMIICRSGILAFAEKFVLDHHVQRPPSRFIIGQYVGHYRYRELIALIQGIVVTPAISTIDYVVKRVERKFSCQGEVSGSRRVRTMLGQARSITTLTKGPRCSKCRWRDGSQYLPWQ